MDQELRDLFGKAVADEPVPLGDITRDAMADGTRIRRRRRLLTGAAAAVVLVAMLGAAGVVGPMMTATSAMQAADGGAATAECSFPVHLRTEKPVLFLSVDDNATGAQREAIERELSEDPLVRGFTWTEPMNARELAQAEGKPYNWRDAERLPGRYRVWLADPDRAMEFLDDYADTPGVDEHGVQLVCRGGVWP